MLLSLAFDGIFSWISRETPSVATVEIELKRPVSLYRELRCTDKAYVAWDAHVLRGILKNRKEVWNRYCWPRDIDRAVESVVFDVVRVARVLLVVAGNRKRLGGLVEWEKGVPRPSCVVHTAPVIDRTGIWSGVYFAYDPVSISSHQESTRDNSPLT